MENETYNLSSKLFSGNDRAENFCCCCFTDTVMKVSGDAFYIPFT